MRAKFFLLFANVQIICFLVLVTCIFLGYDPVQTGLFAVMTLCFAYMNYKFYRQELKDQKEKKMEGKKYE